ncbi:AAA family ATPase [Geobacter benzoatilyticus]|uniref:AAA family ATPase n=1 Tax=Geobacter benzoatilyticus TaxID=2815309 RepID=A0ABX7Q0S9_9BACT|nr:AAA family ATPase [Geobacter benzoatilyticus]QSV45009.1 AAA family ATPase [Geobacter benzoatilyticus]
MSTDLLKRASTFTGEVLNRFYPAPGEQVGDTFSLGKLRHILFAPGELSVWTGLNGHGKSLLLNQLAIDVAKEGQQVAIASFEMSAKRTLYRMVRQAVGADQPADWLITQCLQWLDDLMWIYDHTGTVNTNDLLKTFHKAATERGVAHFVIDSLMKCGIAEDDYNAQKALVDRLQNFAQTDGIHVHLVAHSRKKNNEDDAPGKMDVKGSGAITDLADNVFSVWRNKGKEAKVQQLADTKQTIPDELRNKPDAILDCSKHRELGGDAEGRYGLFYHRASMQFIERPGDLPFFYFEA